MRKKVILRISIVLVVIVVLSLITALIVIPQLSILTCVNSSEYNYQPPENINDGFEVGSLDEMNIDSMLIEKAVKEIRCGMYPEVHSMLIFKDDKLVFEEYFTGHEYKWGSGNYHGDLVTWNRSMLHHIHSDAKSITSACIGIAIDLGFIESVDESIFDYLPEHQHLNSDGKDKITIENLLTMTSALEWDEWGAPNNSPDNPVIGIWLSEKDPLSFILERSLIGEPGTYFNYCGGNMDVLGEILRYASNMSLDDFSNKYLFEPLGIDSRNWSQFENGVIDAASGLKITPRDIAKIGVTFLNEGVWNGTQIISERWVEKSATPFPGNHEINIPGEDSGRFGYSYSWWTKQYSISNMYFAFGWGGQQIMVLPEVNTVVVFTGGNYVTHNPTFRILEEYIIPSFE